jgi:hypothetical protein
VAWAISNSLKPPATLSIDFRTETWIGAAGAPGEYSSPNSGITVEDDVSFVNEDPTPFLVWNPKTGISAFKTTYITNPDDIPPGPLWPGPIKVAPLEALEVNWTSALTLGTIGNVTGLWLDGMKPGTIVDYGTNVGPIFAGTFPNGMLEAVANKAGDAFIALPKGTDDIALDAKAGSYDIAGLVDSPAVATTAVVPKITTAKVPEDGNLLMVLATSFIGVFLMRRRHDRQIHLRIFP